jgi:predicted transcriptional regulator
MFEKNNSTPEIDQITFNWERVKKKASSKREELVANSPNVFKRPVNTSSQTRASATRTTDTLTDPYTNIDIQSKRIASSSPNPQATKVTTNPIYNNTDNRSNNIQDIIDGTHNPNGIHSLELLRKQVEGTHDPELLPAPPAQESTTRCDELLGPERNAVALIRGIKEKAFSGKDLTVDERRLVVSTMRELGQTQDAIADLLKVSRRTIVSDYKVLRQEQALVIQRTETTDIAGEVYATAKVCIRRALQAGSFKTVSVIMRDMVEVLQSLGILYRAPKTSMQAQLHGDIPGRHNGFHKYMDGIGRDKNKVVEVLDCMFDAIGNDQLKDS